MSPPGELAPPPIRLSISLVLVFSNGMPFEGQMRKLSDKFRIELIKGEGRKIPPPRRISHYAPAYVALQVWNWRVRFSNKSFQYGRT